MEGENRLYTVLAVAGGFFCIAAALFFSSALAAAAASVFFFLSLALWKYGYLIVPALTRRTATVQVGKNFEIPPGQEVVLGTQGGSFLATAFLAARLYDSLSEKDGPSQAAYGQMFEKAVSSVGFPFKLCAMVCPLEFRGEMDEIKTKRSIAESRLARLRRGQATDPEAARLAREVSMWNRMIDRLSSGQRPLEVVFYLSTTASGLTRQEAIARVDTQASELSVVIGSALSCEVLRLSGEEMKRCFWWDFFGPTDSDDLHDQLF